MKLSYVHGLELDSAEFWLNRVGWEPSEVAKKISQENDSEKISLVADVGGGHGRDALWLAEKDFLSILVEPNKFSLRFAKERAKNRGLNIYLIDAALPYLPMRSEIIDTVDFYWTLHQIQDEHKLESLKEVRRILKPQGILHSASFGYWEGHEMPCSIYPIEKKQTFLDIHVSAGFKPCGEVERKSDSARSFERYWYGVFQRIREDPSTDNSATHNPTTQTTNMPNIYNHTNNSKESGRELGGRERC